MNVEIAPSVLADWGAWSAQFEGRVPWLYLDVLGLPWACGAGFPPSWPHLSAAVSAQDWRAAAANATGSTLAPQRNAAQVALFLEAADAEPPTPRTSGEP